MTTTLTGVRLVDRPGLHDLLIEDGRVAELTPSGAGRPQTAERTIDASGLLALPGLCNAHVHSNELPLRGRVHGLPQELYHAHIHPFGRSRGPTPDEIYALTSAACLEMLQNGTTMVVDDVYHESDEHLDAAMRAYMDSGLRALVTIHVLDLPWTESVPFLADLLPAGLRSELESANTPPVAEVVRFCRNAVLRWRGRSDRVGCILAPSAPQRCSTALLAALHELSAELDVPLHLHAQETLMQAVGGPLRFGTSMVGHLERLGVLDHRTTIAHGVWLDDADIALLAERRASVVHNPTSNLKLGSGIAPVRKLLNAGVNVALGCDGYTCNDRQDLFEAMKTAMLLSTVCTPHYQDWLTPEEVLRMAAIGGPVANGLDDVGQLRVGARADLVLLDRARPELRPLNDPLAQAVLSGDGRHVHTVIVDGHVLLEGGRTVRADEARIHALADEACDNFLAAFEPGSAAMAPQLQPALHEAYARCLRILEDADRPRDWPVLRQTSGGSR